MTPVECIVEAVAEGSPGTINVRVTRGELDGQAELRCVDNGKRYKVLNFGLAGWQAWAGGYRLVNVECLDGAMAENPLTKGACLVGTGTTEGGESKWHVTRRTNTAALEREISNAPTSLRQQISWLEPFALDIKRLDSAIVFVFDASSTASLASARQLLTALSELKESEVNRLHLYLVHQEQLDPRFVAGILCKEVPRGRGHTYWFRAGRLQTHLASCTEKNRDYVERLTQGILTE